MISASRPAGLRRARGRLSVRLFPAEEDVKEVAKLAKTFKTLELFAIVKAAGAKTALAAACLAKIIVLGTFLGIG